MASIETRPRTAEETFEATAPVYDQLTAHHDYELWLGNLLPALERHGLPSPGSLLDVACGTGKSFLPMLDRGWDVTAADISPAMLALARAKVVDHEVRLETADVRQLAQLGEFDLVWCLDDALNYLLTANDLGLAFEGLGRNLAHEGLLAFDLNTVSAYRWFWSETEEVPGDLPLTWHGRVDQDFGPEGIAEAELAFGDVRIRHRERHHPQSLVLELLDQAGLMALDVYGIKTDAVPRKPLDEALHTKAIYIAKRK